MDLELLANSDYLFICILVVLYTESLLKIRLFRAGNREINLFDDYITGIGDPFYLYLEAGV